MSGSKHWSEREDKILVRALLRTSEATSLPPSVVAGRVEAMGRGYVPGAARDGRVTRRSDELIRQVFERVGSEIGRSQLALARRSATLLRSAWSREALSVRAS